MSIAAESRIRDSLPGSRLKTQEWMKSGRISNDFKTGATALVHGFSDSYTRAVAVF
jgi:hypothetical protein